MISTIPNVTQLAIISTMQADLGESWYHIRHLYRSYSYPIETKQNNSEYLIP